MQTMVLAVEGSLWPSECCQAHNLAAAGCLPACVSILFPRFGTIYRSICLPWVADTELNLSYHLMDIY